MDRRTAAKVKATAVACACGHVFTSEFSKNIIDNVVVCTNCAMAHDYAVAAKNKDYALFN
jgi:hypothetical protein